MTDVADIDYISAIDFSNGFQRFHIKWPLKDLKPKYSSVFETKVIDGQREMTLSWTLGIGDGLGTDTFFGAFLENPDKMIPMVFRASLSSSSNVLYDNNCIGVVDNRYCGCGLYYTLSEVDGSPANDLILQFWIDIPKAIVIGSKKMSGNVKDDSNQKKSSDVFLLDTAKIFNRVIGTEAAGDSSSNISIIIVKKKVCAGRKRGIEEIRRFHCHTDFLASRSTVFERMFGEADWKEHCTKNDRSIEIDDIDALVMEMVLRYIYTSALPDPSTDEEDLLDIVYAADKYDLTELKNQCVGILIMKHKLIRSRIDQLVLADRHNLQQLKSVCLSQLSMRYEATPDHATVKDIPSHLWSQIMAAINEGQATMTEIEVEDG